MICGTCLGTIQEKFYCCCEQISLCKDCCDPHMSEGHHLMDKSMDLSNPISNGSTLTNHFIAHLQALISKVRDVVDEKKRQIESGKYCLRNPNLPPVKFSLIQDHEYFTNSINVNVNLVDENSIIRSVSFPKNESNQYNWRLESNMVNYYLLDWNSKHVIVDGIHNASQNKIIYIISPEKSASTQLAGPENLLSYYPLIHEDILYILGGRCFRGSFREETNEIIRYDLNTMSKLKTLNMRSSRFNIAACFHKEKLWIVSNRCSTLEIIDLTTKESIEGETNVKISEGSVMASDSKQLILMTTTGFYRYSDNFEFETLKEFDREDLRKVKGVEWNLVRPLVLGDKFLFFGSINYITFSSSDCLITIEKINY